MRTVCGVLVLILSVSAAAQNRKRSMAVTIDDLPTVSTRQDLPHRQRITRDLLAKIKAAKVPAIGFVNENKLYADGERAKASIDLLRQWIDAGLELGNHTYSHRSLNRTELADYTSDISKGEVVTKELLAERGRPIRYFRHPFLQTGMTMDVKRGLDEFLKSHRYTIAPVSFDNSEWIFARAYDNAFDKNDAHLQKRVRDAYLAYMESKLDYWERQSVRLFGREIKQTLLIHANFLNSQTFDSLAAMIKRRGYGFITLDEALKDEAYRLPDNFLGNAGISWLHRWALDRGREYILPDEPKTPDFVLRAAGVSSE